MPAIAVETPKVRVGETFVRNFDQGVVKQLQAFLSNGNYFVTVKGVQAPPYSDDHPVEALRRTPMPGVPVIWASPSDAFEDYVNPCIVVRRQDPELALERWNSQRRKYVTPANGAVQSTVNYVSGIGRDGRPYTKTLTGYNKYEVQNWPWAYDLIYTILIRAEGKRAETVGLNLLRHLMRRFQPRDKVDVVDDLGVENSYYLYTEGPTSLHENIDIANRVRGWSLTVKLLGYFDLEDAVDRQAVTQAPTLNVNQMPGSDPNSGTGP